LNTLSVEIFSRQYGFTFQGSSALIKTKLVTHYVFKPW
jgi:hypothetical protein